MIATSFSSSLFNYHESLGADNKQAPGARATSLNVGSSSAMAPRHLERDSFTRKYFAQ